MRTLIRVLKLDEDLPKLQGWWKARKFPPANPEFLPPTGVMVSVNGVDTCAGFLFKSDANAAIIGNIVSNPEAPGKDRNEALDLLIATLAGIAKNDGFGMVCCSTNLPRLMDRFQSHGFIKTDDSVSNFGRVF
jgi:hypothetical protein